jgi:hypothetical protein
MELACAFIHFLPHRLDPLGLRDWRNRARTRRRAGSYAPKWN